MTDGTAAEPVWRVVAQPVGMNAEKKPDGLAAKARKRVTGGKDDKDADNIGGVVVYLAKGASTKEEVARVGFIRETSEHPDRPFKDMLDEIVGVAKQSCDILNALNPDGPLQ